MGELYRYAGLIPLMITAKVSGLFDNYVIDGAVDGFAASFRGIGRRLRFVQRGQMQQSLAFAFAVAAALMVAFLLFSKISTAVLPATSTLPASHVSQPALPPAGLTKETVGTQ